MYWFKIITVLGILISNSCNAQKETEIKPDLKKLVIDKKVTLFNRDVSILNDPKNKNGIHLNGKEGFGVMWLNDIRFGNGTIEFDVRGKNIMQQSFVGIAFHGLNDNTMDAIYFRPFNFQAKDTERRSHSLQYISLPSFDWQKLRTEFPNKYEHAVNPSPLPEEWIHLRVVIKSPKVNIYVNDNPVPDLVVDQLSNQKEGKLGFWVGNNSDGDFANLKIIKN